MAFEIDWSAAILAFAAGILAWGIYYFFFKKEDK